MFGFRDIFSTEEWYMESKESKTESILCDRMSEDNKHTKDIFYISQLWLWFIKKFTIP